MREVLNFTQIIFSILGGTLGYFLGGIDGMIYALISFVSVDYITGVIKAISYKDLSSQIGFKGIAKKILIFMLVGIGNILDIEILGTQNVLRNFIIFFYISNEGISILENVSYIGLPIPNKLKQILKQLNEEGVNKNEQ